MIDKSPWLIGFGLLLAVFFAIFAMSPLGGSHDGNIVWAIILLIGSAIGVPIGAWWQQQRGGPPSSPDV